MILITSVFVSKLWAARGSSSSVKVWWMLPISLANHWPGTNPLHRERIGKTWKDMERLERKAWKKKNSIERTWKEYARKIEKDRERKEEKRKRRRLWSWQSLESHLHQKSVPRSDVISGLPLQPWTLASQIGTCEGLKASCFKFIDPHILSILSLLSLFVFFPSFPSHSTPGNVQNEDKLSQKRSSEKHQHYRTSRIIENKDLQNLWKMASICTPNLPPVHCGFFKSYGATGSWHSPTVDRKSYGTVKWKKKTNVQKLALA